jgi:hypothetical protein
MSGKEVSSQDSCALQKSDIDCKRITDQRDSLNGSTAFEAISEEKICLRSSGFQDSRKHPAVLRRKHDSYKHKKSNGEPQSSMSINPSYESGTTSGINGSKSFSTPVNIFNSSGLNEKYLSNSVNSDNSSSSNSGSSSETTSRESSTVAASESTWLEKSLQPDLDVVQEERKITRRRLRHKYSGKTIPQRRVQDADGEESTIDIPEGREESSS